MFNELTHNEKASLMLSSNLSKQDKPLQRDVYYDVVDALEHSGMELSSLFERDNTVPLRAIENAGLPRQHVDDRLHAGMALALAVDIWSRRGIRVISHMATEYPSELASLESIAPIPVYRRKPRPRHRAIRRASRQARDPQPTVPGSQPHSAKRHFGRPTDVSRRGEPLPGTLHTRGRFRILANTRDLRLAPRSSHPPPPASGRRHEHSQPIFNSTKRADSP